MQNDENTAALVPMLECTQPPVIYENLVDLQERLLSIKETVRNLPMVPENVPEVKKARAELRKYFDSLEKQRKSVRAAVMEPYNQAEAKYKSLISGPINEVDKLCKDFVDGAETVLKQECEADLREYFEELRAANHVEWLPYERCGIVVDLASAKQKTPKKLREQLVHFVARVASDIDRIAEMDDSAEIMVEYQKSLNVADSIGIVLDRHRRIQAQREAAEARAAVKTAEAAAIQHIAASAPEAAQVLYASQEKKYKVTFTITATMPMLRGLKAFLEGHNYEYQEVTNNGKQ